MSTFKKALLKKAHEHCIFNKEEIIKSNYCGCFDCLKIFLASEVVEWIPDGSIETAWCPYCVNDTVIGDASGYPVTDLSFLQAMNNHWCNYKE
jgi:hypothetical protein